MPVRTFRALSPIFLNVAAFFQLFRRKKVMALLISIFVKVIVAQFCIIYIYSTNNHMTFKPLHG